MLPVLRWFRGRGQEALWHVVRDDARTYPGTSIFPGVMPSLLHLTNAADACTRTRN